MFGFMSFIGVDLQKNSNLAQDYPTQARWSGLLGSLLPNARKDGSPVLYVEVREAINLVEECSEPNAGREFNELLFSETLRQPPK